MGGICKRVQKKVRKPTGRLNLPGATLHVDAASELGLLGETKLPNVVFNLHIPNEPDAYCFLPCIFSLRLQRHILFIGGCA